MHKEKRAAAIVRGPFSQDLTCLKAFISKVTYKSLTDFLRLFYAALRMLSHAV
ncbi:hypothetical protein BDD14_3166 [Edaphobacter modestus]|uniref:Uncharacterized protein n=1 Tax=Edaphobacter modestus TaxID=388466 RepID=A0A4Q7YVE5_9BACT|nr:hypothetical protein BDD14_3166 [Edaphobacter modestus]